MGTYSSEEYEEIVENGIDKLLPIIRSDWYLLRCPICEKATLYEILGEPDLGRRSDNCYIHYPTDNVDYLNVPGKIISAFEAAKRTIGIDSSICLLSLRRTLEMICKIEGATGNTLEAKIKKLVSDKKLPPMIEDILYIIRISGNDGAHADNIYLTESQVRNVMNFVGTIINYLYSMPERVIRLKEIVKIKEKEETMSSIPSERIQ
ncbi:MAG: DUF4145 domain-containing protein [Paludibacter sp.]|nr:DUF4145 domain-containing protein [Paludibacter sp.]MDD4429287.1 DUF4145 domain-containing protein [Paludibacter sp.]